MGKGQTWSGLKELLAEELAFWADHGSIHIDTTLFNVFVAQQ